MYSLCHTHVKRFMYSLCHTRVNRSCNPCHTLVKYRNTKITQHALKKKKKNCWTKNKNISVLSMIVLDATRRKKLRRKKRLNTYSSLSPPVCVTACQSVVEIDTHRSFKSRPTRAWRYLPHWVRSAGVHPETVLTQTPHYLSLSCSVSVSVCLSL